MSQLENNEGRDVADGRITSAALLSSHISALRSSTLATDR